MHGCFTTQFTLHLIWNLFPLMLVFWQVCREVSSFSWGERTIMTMFILFRVSEKHIVPRHRYFIKAIHWLVRPLHFCDNIRDVCIICTGSFIIVVSILVSKTLFNRKTYCQQLIKSIFDFFVKLNESITWFMCRYFALQMF